MEKKYTIFMLGMLLGAPIGITAMEEVTYKISFKPIQTVSEQELREIKTKARELRQILNTSIDQV